MHEGGSEGKYFKILLTLESLCKKKKSVHSIIPAKTSNASAIMCNYTVVHLLVLLEFIAS